MTGSRKGFPVPGNRVGNQVFGPHGQILAQHFQGEPLLLGNPDLSLQFAQRIGRFFEGNTVCYVEIRIIKANLKRRCLLLPFRDCSRQGLERVLVLEGQPALGRAAGADSSAPLSPARAARPARRLARQIRRRAAPACRNSRRHTRASARALGHDTAVTTRSRKSRSWLTRITVPG